MCFQVFQLFCASTIHTECVVVWKRRIESLVLRIEDVLLYMKLVKLTDYNT
jgi:hypothetical protein